VSRPISKSEAAVLKRALEVGASEEISPGILASIAALRVTAGCKCGCATVWFGPDGDATVGHMLADALATSNGQEIQVIVWSQGNAIVGLELVGFGTPALLPDAAFVRGYGAA